MQLLEYFKELTIHPKNAEELKGLILQLAIQGKLTQKWREQNPDIEPASVLLEKIEAEKKQLIKEKKIKKEETLPEVKNDVIPFELPNKWKFCSLGDIIKISSGKNLTSAKMDKTGNIPVYGGNGITGYHSEANVFEKTIVIGRVGFYCGSIHLTEDNAWVTDNAFITQYSKLNIYRDFLVWLLKGTNLKEEENATAQPVISGRKLYPIIIPLPPLSEQKAIVSIVNQLFKEVEELEAQTKKRAQLKEDFVQSALKQLSEATEINGEWKLLLQHFKSFFNTKEAVKKLRETILQLAVQGKLTNSWREANPEVESASVLLEKIKAEKELLIKEKKIKKEKPLPEIKEDEIPYELPDGWVWCRMGSLTDIQRGSSPRPKGDPRYFSTEKTHNHWISIKDMTKNSEKNVLLDTEEFLTDLGTQFSRYVNKNELLVAVSGSTTGKCCLTGIKGYFYDGIAMIRLIGNNINQEYHLIYYLKQYNQMNDAKFGAAFPNINTTILSEMMFPLPPHEEQKAIVNKVNSLMTLCDQLEQEIEQNTKQVEDLMKSCLREVVG